MSDEQKQRWQDSFYAELERLFDGRLPRAFDITIIEPDPKILPEEAARDYFVGYYGV